MLERSLEVKEEAKLSFLRREGLEHAECNGEELERPHATESRPGERPSRMGCDQDRRTLTADGKQAVFPWHQQAGCGSRQAGPGSRKLGEMTWGGPSPRLGPAQRGGCGVTEHLVPGTELPKSWQFPDWKLFCYSQSPPFHHPNIYANEVTCGMPLDSFWMGLVARKTTP